MKLEKVIRVLVDHQEWRLGSDEVGATNPKELTEAMKEAIKLLSEMWANKVLDSEKVVKDLIENMKSYTLDNERFGL